MPPLNEHRGERYLTGLTYEEKPEPESPMLCRLRESNYEEVTPGEVSTAISGVNDWSELQRCQPEVLRMLIYDLGAALFSDSRFGVALLIEKARGHAHVARCASAFEYLGNDGFQGDTEVEEDDQFVLLSGTLD